MTAANTAAETREARGSWYGTTARYQQTRFDLPEGREWLVVTQDDPAQKPHEYVVTIWVEEGLGRLASCRCEAFKFGNVCRHIRYAQTVDSMLTSAPVREIKPVYFRGGVR